MKVGHLEVASLMPFPGGRSLKARSRLSSDLHNCLTVDFENERLYSSSVIRITLCVDTPLTTISISDSTKVCLERLYRANISIENVPLRSCITRGKRTPPA